MLPRFMLKTNIENTVKSRKSIQVKTDESRKIYGLTHSSVSRKVSIIRQKMAISFHFLFYLFDQSWKGFNCIEWNGQD
jgi:hypothetical protein